MITGLLPIFFHGCEIKSGSGLGTRLIRDLIFQPPDEISYDTQKQQLKQHPVATEQRRLQQLFSAEKLGNRKPIQLLRHRQQLLGDKVEAMDNSVLRELFLQHLPGLSADQANLKNLVLMQVLALLSNCRSLLSERVMTLR